MTKLNSIRKGDRAEYITQGIFSALGYSLPVLRQEDFGLDFLCTLVESAGKVSFPTKSFTVQLKTNYNNIVYDISNKPKAKWLLENNLPFFICYFDTKENRVDFYSCSMLFHYLITKPPKATKISFRMTSKNGNSVIYLNQYKDSNKIFKIDLGHPFLSISIHDLADETRIQNFRRILDKVLIRENENIVYRNLKLPFMRWLHNYETNNEKILYGWSHFSETNGINSQTLLENMGHIIISLCHNYKMENLMDDYEKLKEFVLRLPFNNDFMSSLINMGFRDKDGNAI